MFCIINQVVFVFKIQKNPEFQAIMIENLGACRRPRIITVSVSVTIGSGSEAEVAAKAWIFCVLIEWSTSGIARHFDIQSKSHIWIMPTMHSEVGHQWQGELVVVL